MTEEHRPRIGSTPGAPRSFSRKTREGFSVLEAIIVLAIVGLALQLIFSVGSKSSDQGFRLGRRSLALIDSDVGVASFRAIVSGLVVPTASPLDPANNPPALRGDVDQLSGGINADRDVGCQTIGPREEIKLSLDHQGRSTNLVCEGSQGRTVLAGLNGTAHFSYSEDGEGWRSDLAIAAEPAGIWFARKISVRTVLVRLLSDDGAIDWLERASSGRPRPIALDLKR